MCIAQIFTSWWNDDDRDWHTEYCYPSPPGTTPAYWRCYRDDDRHHLINAQVG